MVSKMPTEDTRKPNGDAPAARDDGPRLEDQDVTGVTPSWFPDINGKEIGIPAQSGHAAGGVTGNAGDAIQIWVGQYIDPTIHIDKFIGGGRPVNPAIAQAAFGAPTLSLSRPRSNHWDQYRERRRLHRRDAGAVTVSP